MRQAELQGSSFDRYPAQARTLARRNLAVLQQLPLPLLPILLRELGSYDWKFPREQRSLDTQLHWLSSMTATRRAEVIQPFAALQLPVSLGEVDWVNDAAGYMEQLTAMLWSTQQMPAFRAAAQGYAQALDAVEHAPRAAADALASAQEGVAPQAATGHGSTGGRALLEPHSAGMSSQRMVAVVLAASLGAGAPGTVLYRNLRREGVTLDHVDPAQGMEILRRHVDERSRQTREAYAHWMIDGASSTTPGNGAVTQLGYDDLAVPRERLLARAGDAMNAARSGPEELRTLMARLTPEAVGFTAADPVLAHFSLSLLTEGSGTQIFSTTFVQWAARECLRRAQPTTLLARFTPRQREQGMNDLLRGAPSAGLDPQGSLVDADQGAWYTWLNLQRLPQPQLSRFLVWQEGSSTAVVIGPGLPRGKTSSSPMTMPQVLRLLA